MTKMICALGTCLFLTFAQASEVESWPSLDFPIAGIGLNDLPGRSILVNDSLENVKARLSKQWPNANWQERKGSLRNAYNWQYLSLKRNPTAASKQESDLAVILTAEQALAITSSEKEQLMAERRRLLVTDGTLKRARDDQIFEQAYLEIAYFSLGTSSLKGKHDYAALIDVTPVLHTNKPVTLLWISSVNVSTSHSFSLMQCMTGVACIPIPSISTDYTTRPIKHLRFTQAVHKAIDGLDLRSVQDSDLHLNDYFEQLRSHHNDPSRPIIQADTAPLVHTVALPLPVDSRAPRGLQIVATAGDHLVLYSGAEKNSTLLREISWAQGELPNVTLAKDILFSHLYPDPKGFWAVGVSQIQYFNTHDIQTFLPFDQQSSKTAFNPREWQVLPSIGLANPASANGQGSLILRPDGSRAWSKIPPTRQPAIETVYRSYTKAMVLADQQLWFRDAFIFGLNPLSQKISSSLPGRRHADFGSLAGGWGGTCAHSSFCTVFDLQDQTPAWAFSESTFALARTAQGKLLAVGNRFHAVSLWDMPNHRPIARIATPEGMKLIDLSFSWSGDKIWLLYKSPDTQGTMSVRSWDIPVQFRDPANGLNIPYRFQLKDPD